MSNPHSDISITQRSKGKSAGTGAAYQSWKGKIYNTAANHKKSRGKLQLVSVTAPIFIIYITASFPMLP